MLGVTLKFLGICTWDSPVSSLPMIPSSKCESYKFEKNKKINYCIWISPNVAKTKRYSGRCASKKMWKLPHSVIRPVPWFSLLIHIRTLTHLMLKLHLCFEAIFLSLVQLVAWNLKKKICKLVYFLTWGHTIHTKINDDLIGCETPKLNLKFIAINYKKKHSNTAKN